MAHSDPIADFITRIRNAQHAKLATVEIPMSRIKVQLANLLKDEGFVSDVEVLPKEGHGKIRVTLRYLENGEGIIREIRRVSKPGRRMFQNVDILKSKQSGIATRILTTSKGILTDHKAIQMGLGGEVMVQVM